MMKKGFLENKYYADYVINTSDVILIDIYNKAEKKIGWLTIKKENGEFFIKKNSIDKDCRRLNICRTVLYMACEELRKKGCSKLFVEPSPEGWDGVTDRKKLLDELYTTYEHLGFFFCEDNVDRAMSRNRMIKEL